MEALNLFADLEQRAAASGITLAKACADAKIAYSTLRRWKKGITNPTQGTYEKVIAVIHGQRAPKTTPRRKRAG